MVVGHVEILRFVIDLAWFNPHAREIGKAEGYISNRLLIRYAVFIENIDQVPLRVRVVLPDGVVHLGISTFQ